VIKALIFDFDGLILDTETPEYRAWVEVYEGFGLTLPRDQWMSMIGRGTHEIVWTPYLGLEELLGPIDQEAVRTQKRARFAELMSTEVVRPGVVELMGEADALGVALAVASSSGHSWVDDYLQRLDIFDRFDAILCRGDVERTKPAPDLYLAAVAALGVNVDEVVALEDSPNGIAAAKAAGLYCIAVPNEITKLLDLSAADRIVESLAEVRLRSISLFQNRQ